MCGDEGEGTYAAVGGSVLSGEDGEEDLLGREDGRDGVDATREGLSKELYHGISDVAKGSAEERTTMSGFTAGLCWKQSILPVRASPCGSELAKATAEARGRTNGLDLVADEEHIVLLAKRLAPLKVVLVRHDNAARAKRTNQRSPILVGGKTTYPASP